MRHTIINATLLSYTPRTALAARAPPRGVHNWSHTVCTATSLRNRRCHPCEESSDAMEFMGMCRAMDATQAEAMRSQLDDGWAVSPDGEQHLRLCRAFRTRNFVSALELCNRIGDIAEAEGHHPDLHIESWNRLRVEVWTHSSKGLTENDFILASKIDALDKEGLLSKKKA